MTQIKINNTRGEILLAASTAPASSSGIYADPREDSLAQYTEEIIDPGRPIVDTPHHRRQRLVRWPLDVPRARARGVPARRRGRVCQWRGGDGRERRLREGRDL